LDLKIERALTGLQSAFKLFSQGRLPGTMSDTIVPGCDVLTFAARAAGLKVYQFPVVAAAVGIIGTKTLTEDWLIVGANFINQFTAANEIAAGTISYLENANATPAAIAGLSRHTTTVSVLAGEERYGEAFNLAFPIWAGKGSLLIETCSYVAGGPSVYGTVLYYEL